MTEKYPENYLRNTDIEIYESKLMNIEFWNKIKLFNSKQIFENLKKFFFFQTWKILSHSSSRVWQVVK